MDSKEEQIAQAMAYVKMVKESGKTCGLMDDLQHMGEDGTDWKEETQKKAAKWDSLMKWIKESSETYDSDCDNDRDVDTIWDKLDSLDYQELNSKDNN